MSLLSFGTPVVSSQDLGSLNLRGECYAAKRAGGGCLASFYGREFHDRRTGRGTRFDMNAMVAAHPSYPFCTQRRGG